MVPWDRTGVSSTPENTGTDMHSWASTEGMELPGERYFDGRLWRNVGLGPAQRLQGRAMAPAEPG